MNAPTPHQHLIPAVAQREVPAEMIAALQARFGANCSTALVVREQHGRDESPFVHVPPPAAVVFAECTQDVADAVALAAKAAGARSLWAQPLFLKDSARKVFMPWLEAEFPALLVKYRSWYQRDAYLQGAYVEGLTARVERIRLRHGLTGSSKGELGKAIQQTQF